MSERLFLARFFIIFGLVLAVVGLTLWFVLRIPALFPPYLVTALLALAYGAYCRWTGRLPVVEKS